MGNDDKVANKGEGLLGKAKEKLGDATDNQRPAGRGQEGPEQGRPQAGRREGQGRVQGLTSRPPDRAAPHGLTQPSAPPVAFSGHPAPGPHEPVDRPAQPRDVQAVRGEVLRGGAVPPQLGRA